MHVVFRTYELPMEISNFSLRVSSQDIVTEPPTGNGDVLYSEDFGAQGVGTLPSGYVIVFNGRGDAEQRVEEDGGNRHLRTAARRGWSLSMRRDLDFDLPDVTSVSWRMRVDSDLTNYGYTDPDGASYAHYGGFGVKNTAGATAGFGIYKYQSDGKLVAYCAAGGGSRPELQLGAWHEFRMEIDFAAGRYSIYKDGVKFCDNTTGTADLSGRWNPWAEPSAILLSSGNSGSSVTRFDDIVVSSGSGAGSGVGTGVGTGSSALFSEDFSSGTFDKWTTAGKTSAGGSTGPGRLSIVDGVMQIQATAGGNYTVRTEKEISIERRYDGFELSFDWKGITRETPWGLDAVRLWFYDDQDRTIGLLVAVNSGQTPRGGDPLDHTRPQDLSDDRYSGIGKVAERFDWETVTLTTAMISGMNPRNVVRLKLRVEVYNNAGSGGEMHFDNFELRAHGTGGNMVGGSDGSSERETVTDSATVRQALEALYDATGGPGWTASTNWKTEAPLGEWHGVEADAGGQVVGLNFEANELSGPIPRELGKLTNLRLLKLDNNELSGAIPRDLGNLTNLEYLDLSINDLSGPIPPELGNLTSIGVLNLSQNELSGPIPHEFNNLTEVSVLHLYRNKLSGPVPAWLGNRTFLDSLDLSQNALSGAIPHELGDLTNLELLDLSGNQLSGTIPHQLGDLTNLGALSLSSNELGGAIPHELGNLTNLERLDLSGNQLSGTIPHQLGDLTNLGALSLSSNELGGAIPHELGNLTNLERLDLSNNALAGQLPSSLTDLRQLRSFRFQNNAGLSAPATPAFAMWLDGIADLQGPMSGSGGLPSGENFDLDPANNFPVGMTFANGRFHVVDRTDAKVYAYTASGQRDAAADFRLHPDNDHPVGATFVNGRFHVVDERDGRVYAYTASGQHDAAADFDVDPANNVPGWITFANGRFYVGNLPDRKAYAYTASGGRATTTIAVAPANDNPIGLVFAGGRFYTCDTRDEKVYAYTASGQRDAAADFDLHPDNDFPTGITFVNGWLYVADLEDLKVYSYPISVD